MRLFSDLRARLFGHPDAAEVDAVADSAVSPDDAAQSDGGESIGASDEPTFHEDAAPTADAVTVEPESPSKSLSPEVEQPSVGTSASPDTPSRDVEAVAVDAPAEDHTFADGTETDAVAAARQERAAGRILDDEGLRGDLADDEFQPLLDWALGVADRLAAATAGQGDAAAEQTIDAGLEAVRDIVEEAGYVLSAHVEGDAGRLRSGLQFIGERWRTVVDTVSDVPADYNPEENDAPLRSDGVGTGLAPIGEVDARLSTLADRLEAEPGLSGGEVVGGIVAALQPATSNESGSGEGSA